MHLLCGFVKFYVGKRDRPENSIVKRIRKYYNDNMKKISLFVFIMMIVLATGLAAMETDLKLYIGMSRTEIGHESVKSTLKPVLGMGMEVWFLKNLAVEINTALLRKDIRNKYTDSESKLEEISLSFLVKKRFPMDSVLLNIFAGYDLGFITVNLPPGWPQIDSGFVLGGCMDFPYKKSWLFVDIRYRFKGPELGFDYRSSFQNRTLLATVGIKFRLFGKN